MTAAEKANNLVFAKLMPMFSGPEKERFTMARECALWFCDEMIATFKRITETYSTDFQKSLDFWIKVKEELALL